jgi:hypothetical protein
MNRTVETLGLVLLSSLFGFIIFFPIYLVIKETTKETSKEPPQPKFEVVDKYEGCDVVRYDPGSIETYKYFLKCPK